MSKIKFAWKAEEKFTPEQIRSQKTKEYISFQEIGCHLIFDVKIDFTRKARFVAGGHTIEAPLEITYLSVVSRDSVRLDFMIAALNGLDIMSCDLENAYLNRMSRENIWFEEGIECGEDTFFKPDIFTAHSVQIRIFEIARHNIKTIQSRNHKIKP